MERDDIIRMAREVADPDTVDPLCGGDQRDLITLNLDEMLRFAELVAASEREACARFLERGVDLNGLAGDPQMQAFCGKLLMTCAEAIRARGDELKRHPGYIIGDHWLQAAYTRICTGETEDEVMTDYGWQRESR